jgi:hypothetical protein
MTVPRDLLRAYKALREETDDAFAAGNLVRVAELLPGLDALRGLVRRHLDLDGEMAA